MLVRNPLAPSAPALSRRIDEAKTPDGGGAPVSSRPDAVDAGASRRSAVLRSIGAASPGAPAPQPRGRGAGAARQGMSLLASPLRALRRGAFAAVAGFAVLAGGDGPAKSAPQLQPQAQREATLEVARSPMQMRIAASMPRALPDAQALYARFEAEHGSQPGFALDRARAEELVAAALLPQRAEGTVEERIAFAQKKLGPETKVFLAGVLDAGRVPFAADGKALLERVLGRASAAAADGSFVVTGDQSGGLIRGRAAPGAQIEAINLTAIATARIHTDETTVIGTAGPDGAFEGALPMNAGDVVRLRVRVDGKESAWVDFKAQGLGEDTRNAEVALYRIGMFAGRDGAIRVENINASRPISEPGAIVRFVNERTGEHRDFTMNDKGTFAGPASLPGQDGDRFSVRVSDGTNDKELAVEVGQIQVGRPQGAAGGVDLPDPELHPDELDEEGKPRFHLVRYSGPLFEAEPTIHDVRQGAIGDCYLPSAVAAALHADPDLIKRMMKQNEDGTYTVTFKERDYRAPGGYRDVPITVDGDLYVRSYGGPLYGTDDGDRQPERMEMWWPILEKAYAEWQGGYDDIGMGGSSSRVFEQLLGRRAQDLWITSSNADAVWDRIVAHHDAKSPISAGTYGESERARYTNTGVYANHSYSIIGYETREDGRYVKLRNPWGESEPRGNGENDGIFFLKLEDFTKLYRTLYTVELPAGDR